MLKNNLYQPFEKLETRPGPGGRTVTYVPAKDVLNRMNEVFACNWSSHIEWTHFTDTQVIVRVRVSAFDPEKQVQFHQEGFGGHTIRETDEPGNAFKSAYSKALRDACKKWGVGLYLEAEAEVIDNIPPGYMAKETAPVMPDAPMAPPAPPVPPSEPKPEPAAVPEVPPMAPTVPTEPKVNQPPVMPAPAEPSVPPMPEATIVPPTAPAPQVPPVASKPAFIPNEEAELMINDVQKVAISGITQMKEVAYDTLVKLAFEHNGWAVTSIPEKDNLTHDQAIAIIKYGNNVYKKPANS